MPDSQLVSFKDMCARFDVTPRTLRYYEYIELLSPKKVGRARFYGPREIARMTLILRGRRFGFSLEQKGNREQLQYWIRRADEQLAALNQQMEELEIARADLKQLRDESAQELKDLG